MKKELKQVLEKQHYEIVGNHSAVEICSWNKKSLLDKGVCYKQKFYGINCHRCCQMTPTAGFCDQKCVFCWRAHEYNQGIKMGSEIDDPKKIVNDCILAQRNKLSGFKGNEKVNMEKWKEAQEPMHFAISLTGEPTLYPKLGELIEELHKRGKTTFLVTNALHPEVLKKLQTKKQLPTQLYISLDAPNEEIHKKTNIPLIKNSWNKINKTLELLPDLNTRKVIRITLIKGLNDKNIKEYAKLIKKADPNWVEVKAYMWIGYSRRRLKKENMPFYKDVKDFANKLMKELDWKTIDESKPSRVVLISKDSSKRLIIF